MHDDAAAVLDQPMSDLKSPAPAAARFEMPHTHNGQLVTWQRTPRDGETCPALVTKVGNDQVSLQIFVDGSSSMFPQDGVRHRDDPRWTEQNGESGVWSHTETDAETDEAYEHLADAIDNQGRVLEELVARSKTQDERLATLEALIAK